jgi:hypothetical protein
MHARSRLLRKHRIWGHLSKLTSTHDPGSFLKDQGEDDENLSMKMSNRSRHVTRTPHTKWFTQLASAVRLEQGFLLDSEK